MRADWYSATLPAEADEVLPVLLRRDLGATGEPSRPLHGFNSAVDCRARGQVYAKALWGGVNGNDVHVQFSGLHAPWGMQTVRKCFPDHRVARFDACEDFSQPGAWDLVSDIVLGVADRHDVKVQHQGDWHRCIEGRTLYLGGKKSLVQLCAYEKGKQLGQDPNWVRVELRVKPKGDGKSHLSTAEPDALFGCAKWARDLGACLGRDDIEKLPAGDPWRASDDERAVRFMLTQYGNVLERLATTEGSWCGLGVYLGEQLKTIREGILCGKNGEN